MTLLAAHELKARAAQVRLLVLDVDGVLTDGSLVYGSQGEALKVFHVRDGLGIRMVLEFGIEVAVITARRSEVLAARMRDLRIQRFVQGQDDKLAAFEQLLAELGLRADQACFVGDDLLDLPVLRRVGLAVSVADGHPLVHEVVHHVTSQPGGKGAVREVADLLLDSQVGLALAVERFLASKLGKGEMEKV